MLTNTRTQAGKAIELKDEMELVIKAVRLNTLATNADKYRKMLTNADEC